MTTVFYFGLFGSTDITDNWCQTDLPIRKILESNNKSSDFTY